MPIRPAPLPDHLGDVFSVRAARSAGVTARRLRSAGLSAPFFGVRVRTSDDDGDVTADTNVNRKSKLDRSGRLDGSKAQGGTKVERDSKHDGRVADIDNARASEARRLTAEIEQRARAFAEIMPADWFFCHVTAAVLWGLPLPLRMLRAALQKSQHGGRTLPPRGLDVGVMSPRPASRAAGTRGHQLSQRLVDVRAMGGLRLSSPESTWALLAADLTVDELVELGDAVVRIPRARGMVRGTDADALATLPQLASAANTPYRRHRRALRDALAQVRVGSASPGETRTRLACVRAGLPEPELDYDVYALDGSAIGFTELAFPHYRVLVEYEGDHHRTDRTQWQRDVDKHAACVDAGYEVLRLTARNVYPSTQAAVARIRAALLRAGWRP